MTRPIPKRAIEFVARYEGFRAKAYLCSGNVPTIGFGHTEGVKLGQTVTRDRATLWLAEDMQIAQRKLYSVLKPEIIDELTEGQWCALLSFAFNVGAAPGWTIWKLLNARKFDQAADQLSRFINAGGVKVQGLVNRRADEFKMWHEDAPEEDVPSTFTRGVGITPPTPETRKPIWMSKTFWTGGGIAGAATVQTAATTVQGIAAPQAYHSPWIAKVVGLTAVLIVAAGVAIMVFKAIENWQAKHK